MWHPAKAVAPFEILVSWFDSSPSFARILGMSDMNGLKECFPVTLDSRRSLGGFGWDCRAGIQKRSMCGTSIKGCERVLLIKNSLTV
jgi:hypothetical protein